LLTKKKNISSKHEFLYDASKEVGPQMHAKKAYAVLSWESERENHSLTF